MPGEWVAWSSLLRVPRGGEGVAFFLGILREDTGRPSPPGSRPPCPQPPPALSGAHRRLCGARASVGSEEVTAEGLGASPSRPQSAPGLTFLSPSCLSGELLPFAPSVTAAGPPQSQAGLGRGAEGHVLAAAGKKARSDLIVLGRTGAETSPRGCVRVSGSARPAPRRTAPMRAGPRVERGGDWHRGTPQPRPSSRPRRRCTRRLPDLEATQRQLGGRGAAARGWGCREQSKASPEKARTKHPRSVDFRVNLK